MLMLSNRINQWLLSSKVSLVVPCSLKALNVGGILCSIKDQLQRKIIYAYYCLNMLIWSCNAQNNTFNNIIMVNFQDIKPQNH